MPPRISDVKKQQIIDLSGKEYNKTQVAKIAEVTVKVVTRIEKENGLKFAIASNTRTCKEIELKVLDLYNEGHNTAYISKEFNLTLLNVNRILKRNGVSKIPRNMLDTTIEDIKDICRLYKKGFSTVDLALIYKDKIKCDHTIARILKDNGIEVGTAGTKSIVLNEDFFKTIDTEQKAYYLGFIYADGNVTSHDNTYIFQMELKASDGYILEQIRDTLQVKKKMKDFVNKEIYYIPKKINNIRRITKFKDKKYKKVYYGKSIQVVSKKIYDDLNSHGVIENKTFNVSFPSTVPNNLIRHFLRGFFDGDGSVTECEGRYRYTFYGQPSILESINELLVRELGMNEVNVFDKETLSQLSFATKKDVVNLYHYFYDDSNFFLERKRNKILPYVGAETTNSITPVSVVERRVETISNNRT